MARLKAMVKSALDDRSPRFLLGTVALGVVVALLTGVAIGYTVDTDDGGGGGRRARVTQQRKNRPKAPRLKEGPLLVGGVYSLNARKVVVLDAKAKPRPMGLGRNTRIYETSAGKASDVTVGSRVIFAPSASGATTATEVIVLPEKAAFGQEVTAVKRGTSMSLRTLDGTDVVKTDGATVLKTETGRRTDLAKGEKVIVRFFVVRGRRNQATQIVVLPKDTKFK
jgi:hypothetical protein